MDLLYRDRYRVAVMLPPEQGASKLPVYETLEKSAKQKTEKKAKPPACANVDTKSSAVGAHRGDARHILLPTSLLELCCCSRGRLGCNRIAPGVILICKFVHMVQRKQHR